MTCCGSGDKKWSLTILHIGFEPIFGSKMTPEKGKNIDVIEECLIIEKICKNEDELCMWNM